ncbi:MAG: phosphomannomutase/phosphoglucomutase [Candidatus Latescibacteria bacterium]|nr:phosphomannomutase/phosphoglucomutase [Candidatus Latescibacterota bacterium]
MNKNIFREYDIRGLAETDLTDEVVRSIGKGYGSYLLEQGIKELIIGRDVRLSGERIRDALVDGLLSAGCDVIDLGIVPTPVFYFSAFHYDKNAGVMITGSHNPKEFNGFKVGFNKSTIYGEEIQNLRKLIERGKFKSGNGKISAINPIPDYIGMILNKVKIKSGLKVVFDPGNGTAGLVIEELFNKLGVEPVFINLEPDGNFPNHLPDPTIPEYMKDVKSLVGELHAHLGIGFDGDADRIGAIDDKGEIVWGDKLLAIFAQDIIKRKPKAKIVFEVKCSQGLVEYIQSIGGIPIMWKTGHSLIKAKMKQENAVIAGEMSGHMFFADDYYGFDDAIYAAARLLKIIAESGKSLSQLVAEIPFYYSTPEIRVPCPDELKFDVVNSIRDFFKKSYETLDIDGVRVIFDDGWGLVRASNTQPILVLRFEAKTEQRLQEIEQVFYHELAKFQQVKIS